MARTIADKEASQEEMQYSAVHLLSGPSYVFGGCQSFLSSTGTHQRCFTHFFIFMCYIIFIFISFLIILGEVILHIR